MDININISFGSVFTGALMIVGIIGLAATQMG